MIRRLQLAFPLLFLGLVTAVILWNVAAGSRRDDRGHVYLDPVCAMEVREGSTLQHGGQIYHFCATQCLDAFAQDPSRYTQASCPVCRAEGQRVALDLNNASPHVTWNDEVYYFCSTSHQDAFRADPGGFFMHTMWGIPNWLYYCSIAIILILSFGLIELLAKREGRGPPPRVNLLAMPWLRAIVAHPRARFWARLALVAAFVTILSAGLFGRQLPSRNLAPILTWTIWWGGLVWLVALLGKAWCYACPWDAIADWAEGVRLWGRKHQGLTLALRWPAKLRNIWPATILFVGLTWVELGYGVTMKPRATAWLGLAMLAMAFASAFIFDRRSFCRYGCLVGRISGLYALFAPIEVRAANRDTCRSCQSSACFKGNDQGEACPTYQHLASMDQNTYCIQCMECVKTCDKNNVALNWRPWGSDLIEHHRPRSDEAYLALLMLTLTAFHGLTMTGVWGRIVAAIEGTLSVGPMTAFTVGMSIVVALPVAVYAGLVALSRWMSRTDVAFRDYFIRYAYALLPIAFFYHLAHNSEHLLMEGQKVVTLASDPFGYGWNLFQTAEMSLRPLVDLPTLWVLQVLFVMVGHIFSLWAARRAAAAIFPSSHAILRSQFPMLLAMILFSVLSLWLLKQPMEMRTSAM